MRVVATNDDGVDAIGLAVLASAVGQHGRVVEIVAPSVDLSGSGASLGPVADEARVTVSFRPGGAKALDAPPAFGIRAACSGAFGPRPDLVVSGINPGFNTGRLVMHSGTVGAAITAATMNVCGVAFSTSAHPVHGYETAAEVAKRVVAALVSIGLPPVTINVNVPDVVIADIQGIRFTGLAAIGATDLDFDAVEGVVVVRRRANPPPYEQDSEANLLGRGFVVVSVLTLPWQTKSFVEAVALALGQHLTMPSGTTSVC